MELISSLATLGMLIFLQAVLGFDNLLYLSIESKRAPKAEQANVRRLGVIIAVLLRLVLLFRDAGPSEFADRGAGPYQLARGDRGDAEIRQI